MLPAAGYEPAGSVEVNGRQGVCAEGGHYWVSGSATLAKYDADWNLLAVNESPFEGYEAEVNHIGDIDIYNGELYVGAEYFMDGEGKNIRIAVYDADTLTLKRSFPFEPESGQLECSGLAVDPDHGTVWMCSWAGEESSRYLYKYDLETGEYLGKVHMQMPPQWIQGVAYHDGCLYLTADDGRADDGEPDHLYRTKIEENAVSCTVTLERTFDDVTMQGEIEGLTFDAEKGRLLVLYNRGARIILGMARGFYEGYDREISEVFTYEIVDDREEWDFALDTELSEHFEEALEGGELEVWFQPIMDPASETICGAEALSRWQMDDGYVSPSVFIPVLEETGQIRDLDEHVFRTVCDFQKERLAKGEALFPVSVNLSAASALREDVAKTYETICRDSGLPAGAVNLEITESLEADTAAIAAVVQEFQAAGFAVEIDDFGAGYASYADLAAIPYDILKIDKSLVDGIGGERGESLVESVISLAKNLHMSVIAEGVETAEQVEFLKNLGCGGIQGYYYARPMPREDFEAFYAEPAD